MEIPKHDDGIIVEDNVLKKSWMIGSLGMVIQEMVITLGNFSKVFSNPENYIFVLDYDCPYELPLADGSSSIFKYENSELKYFHNIKKRGQQEFSTLEVLRLPRFSSFQVRGYISKDVFKYKDKIESSSKVTTVIWGIITYLNERINDLVDDKYKIDFKHNRILSYRVRYIEKNNLYNSQTAVTIVPYTEIIDLRSPQKTEYLNEDILKLYLNEKLKLQNYYKDNIPDPEKNLDFSNKIFQIVHDFAFYSSERPEALSKLSEELIRDLFLVPVKMFAFSAEAEAYTYDGRLDFKISNPNNKYEIVSGEFKIWRGISSFNECYQQISEKHTSGNESELYLIMINQNNKNVKEIYDKCLVGLKREDSYIKTLNENISLSGSQLFSKHIINIKGFEIPLILGILNVFHEKV